MGDVIDFKRKEPDKKPKSAELIAKAIIDHITVSIDDGPHFVISEDELVALGLPDMKSFDASMNDKRLNDLHDASFDIQLLAEETPDIAEYATKKLQELYKILEIYKNNLKKG
jgi:hypothetical protein